MFSHLLLLLVRTHAPEGLYLFPSDTILTNRSGTLVRRRSRRALWSAHFGRGALVVCGETNRAGEGYGADKLLFGRGMTW